MTKRQNTHMGDLKSLLRNILTKILETWNEDFPLKCN